VRRLFENRREPGADFIDERLRQGVDFPTLAGFRIDYARLIAAHRAGCLDTRDRHVEADPAGEITPIGDGQDPRSL